MATMLNDGMAAAINFMGSARETSASAVDAAKSAVETAKEGTGHAVTSARSTLMDGVHAVTGLASMLRSLQPEDALGWVGLARRRSPLLSFAVFTAGFAAGAGAGLLLAPTSGADLRKNLLKGLQGLMGDAKDVAEKAEAKVEKIEDKAEKIAGKAKDKVENFAGKAKDKAEDLAGKAKDKAEDLAGNVKDAARKVEDKVETKAAAATSAVKESFQDAKSMVAAATDPAHDSHVTNEPNKTARNHTNTHRHS
jgi:gas vesicle protein